MSKIINILVAVWASLVAITVGYVAQDFFDVSVRASALIGAAIFVLIYA
jgi:Na+/H+ antiporter NhaD/arsenite permease-like protein